MSVPRIVLLLVSLASTPGWASQNHPAAPVCGFDTLLNYTLLAGGCTFGNNIVALNFTFANGGTNPIDAAQIFVTPTVAGGVIELVFTSPFFTLGVGPGQTSTFSLEYNIDPHPIILSFEDEFEVSSPVFPGFARVDTVLCVGDVFPACLAPVAMPNLFLLHNGAPVQLIDGVAFAPQSLVGVRHAFVLDGGPGGGVGSANIDAFINRIGFTPEPGGFVLVGLGLAALGLVRRRKS